MVIHAKLMWAQARAGTTDLLVYRACPDSSTPALKGCATVQTATAGLGNTSGEGLGRALSFLSRKICTSGIIRKFC